MIISICWTFSFQILNEVRHLLWDLGYGFDLKIAKITGLLVFIGSFILTILFLLLEEILFDMHNSTKKWLFTKLSSLILIPLMCWFVVNLVKIYDNDYQEVVTFFSTQPSKIIFSVFVVIAYFFSALTISEIFEDYIGDDKIKNVANKTLNIFAIIIPLLTINGILSL